VLDSKFCRKPEPALCLNLVAHHVVCAPEAHQQRPHELARAIVESGALQGNQMPAKRLGLA